MPDSSANALEARIVQLPVGIAAVLVAACAGLSEPLLRHGLVLGDAPAGGEHFAQAALRPGMSASAEIIVDQLADVLYVPIQSVQTDAAGKHYCFLENGERREVALGARSRSYTVVTDGLQVGDRIQMVPPELKKETEE